mmetsp:Transcript_19433/g.34646  ORF Transcript_19433/g.34646 Transcript_19433/m.34646 type:complete len:506 (+) Transcript_19433:293-1810(+)
MMYGEGKNDSLGEKQLLIETSKDVGKGEIGGGGLSPPPTLKNFVQFIESGTSQDADPKRNESSEARAARRKLVIATLVCVLFMLVEVVGGYLSGSLAIMTDAAHLLSDIAGFLISLFALYLAERKPTVTLTFGFKRAEIIGAILSVMLIWFLTGVLLWAAVTRTSGILDNTNTQPVDGKSMFMVACFGLVANITLLFVLGHDHGHGHSHGGGHGHSHGHEPEEIDHSANGHGHSHGGSGSSSHGHGHGHGATITAAAHETQDHGHGHSHGNANKHANAPSASTPALLGTSGQPPSSKAKPTRNINVSAAYVHAIGDLIQSIGVCIAGSLIWAYPASNPDNRMMQLADPAATFLFSILVLYSTYEILTTSLRILMEGVPTDVDPMEIAQSLSAIPSVVDVHHLHVWSISVGYPSLSVHLIVRPGTDLKSILGKAQHVLREHGIEHSTVQTEIHDQEVCGPSDCSGTPCNAYAISCENGNCFDDFLLETKQAQKSNGAYGAIDSGEL